MKPRLLYGIQFILTAAVGVASWVRWQTRKP